jgi:hypothetical protein
MQGLFSVAGYKNQNRLRTFQVLKTKPRSEKDCRHILHRRTELARCFDPPTPRPPTVPCTTPSPLLDTVKINISPLFFPIYIYISLNLFLSYFDLDARSRPANAVSQGLVCRAAPLRLNLSNSRCLSPTLKRESVRSFETTVNFYQSIRRHVLEEAFFSVSTWQTQIAQVRYE